MTFCELIFILCSIVSYVCLFCATFVLLFVIYLIVTFKDVYFKTVINCVKMILFFKLFSIPHSIR